MVLMLLTLTRSRSPNQAPRREPSIFGPIRVWRLGPGAHEPIRLLLTCPYTEYVICWGKNGRKHCDGDNYMIGRKQWHKSITQQNDSTSNNVISKSIARILPILGRHSRSKLINQDWLTVITCVQELVICMPYYVALHVPPELRSNPQHLIVHDRSNRRVIQARRGI